MATNRYVDSTTGNNADDGTTPALAWATVEYALESGTLAADYNVWVRRLHSEIPASDIAAAYDGAAGTPIQVIGWPRAAIPNTTITEGDWTNGSNLVDNVVGITPDREKHIARYCTAPDGKIYLITAVIWEAPIDGMAAGAEFVVGEILTNVTQTKKGKVWGFTDNTDTTGTLQYVRDSSTAWVDNDNITSDGAGDAEIAVGGETAVGFLIDREYPGGTVTGVNGKFQIEADDDYAARPQAGIDALWDDDAIDLPLIDFNDGDFQLVVNADLYHVFKNMEFKDSSDGSGIIYFSTSDAGSLIGCLIKQSVQNTELIGLSTMELYLERVIVEGSGAGSGQELFMLYGAAQNVHAKDCAFYNLGDYGFNPEKSKCLLNNVNIGVEMANGDDDIYIRYSVEIVGKDVKLGGTNGYIAFNVPTPKARISIGNFQKILGNHVTYFPGGAVGATGGFKNVDVGDTNAPSAASTAGSTTDLIAIYPNVTGFEFIEDWAVKICEWKIWAAAAAETYTVYIQNNMGVTLNDVAAKDDIWLKLTYIDTYDDTTEYNKTELFSTEIDILQRADGTDWDSLTIANHTPSVAGWAILELYVSKYVAAGQIYVDPLWV